MDVLKKIVALSVFALVIGIVTTLPLAYIAVNAPVRGLMSETQVFTVYGTFEPTTWEPAMGERFILVSPDTENGNYTLIPINEFYAIYGGNATLPQHKLEFKIEPASEEFNCGEP